MNKMKNKHLFLFKKGYIALATIIVIASLITTIGLGVALPSISEGQLSLAGKKSEESGDFIESCVEEALLFLNEKNSLPEEVILPQGSCTISLNSQEGDDWTFTVSGAVDNYCQPVEIEVQRNLDTLKLVIINWKKV